MSANLNLVTVQEMMTARGIDSYSELARLAGIERSYLSRVMRGERPAQPSQIVAIAAALKVPQLALLGPSDPDAAQAELDEAVAS